MGLKVTNNAFGTLNAGITNSDTTVVLQAGQGSRFPSLASGDYFYATLIDTSNNLEIVKVTARSTDTMTIVRAQDNTTARAYSTNDRFELRPTAAMYNEKVTNTGDTMTGPLGLVINNPIPGIARGDTPGTDGIFKDTTSTGNRSVLAIRTGAATTVPFSIVEAGTTQNQSTAYGVLNLARLNHDNAEPAYACMFFESKDSSGTIREWGGIGSSRNNIDGSDNRGRTTIFVYNSAGDSRRIAASWDYKGRMTNNHQPACACSIGDGGSNRSVAIATNTIIPIYPHVDYDSNVASNRFTAPVSGLYHVAYNVEIQGSSSGRYGVVIRKNGSQYFGSIEYFNAGSGNWQNASASGNVPLSAGDYVELWTEAVPSGAVVWYANNPGGNGNFSVTLIG